MACGAGTAVGAGASVEDGAVAAGGGVAAGRDVDSCSCVAMAVGAAGTDVGIAVGSGPVVAVGAASSPPQAAKTNHRAAARTMGKINRAVKRLSRVIPCIQSSATRSGSLAAMV